LAKIINKLPNAVLTSCALRIDLLKPQRYIENIKSKDETLFSNYANLLNDKNNTVVYRLMTINNIQGTIDVKNDEEIKSYIKSRGILEIVIKNKDLYDANAKIFLSSQNGHSDKLQFLLVGEIPIFANSFYDNPINYIDPSDGKIKYNYHVKGAF
jgi:hypothetical protein